MGGVTPLAATCLQLEQQAVMADDLKLQMLKRLLSGVAVHITSQLRRSCTYNISSGGAIFWLHFMLRFLETRWKDGFSVTDRWRGPDALLEGVHTGQENKLPDAVFRRGAVNAVLHETP